MHQSAKKAVAHAIHHEKFLKSRPWLIKTSATRYAMIAIRYKIVDGDGEPVMLHTWAIGLTVMAAVRIWRERFPAVLKDDFEYDVVTEPKVRDRDPAQGDRVVPPDPFLAAS